MRFKTFKLDKFDSETGEISGYGAVFGNKDSYNDIILPKAFENTLQKNEPKAIKMLWQHDTHKPIGIWEKFESDEHGLKLGALDGLSIGYRIVKEAWDASKSANMLEEIDLKEVSVVTFPANDLARLSEIKSDEDLSLFKRQTESILREAGYSVADCKSIVANGVTAQLIKRDADSNKDNKELSDEQ